MPLNQSCHRIDEVGSLWFATKESHLKGLETTAHLNKSFCSKPETGQSSFPFLLRETLELESHILNLLPLPFLFTHRFKVLNWVVHIWCLDTSWVWFLKSPDEIRLDRSFHRSECAAENKLGKEHNGKSGKRNFGSTGQKANLLLLH